MNTNDQSEFSKTCGMILGGEMPLFGALSDRQVEDGKTACAIPVVAPDLPGCLAIAVLRNRRLQVVASYQKDVISALGFEEDKANELGGTLDEVQARLTELSERCAAALNGNRDANVMFLTDTASALSIVSSFHVASSSAH